METKLRSHYTRTEYTYLKSGPPTSLDRKYVIIAIFCVQIFEVNIIPVVTFVIKIRVHIALHVLKQVQIIHKLMKCVASTTLHKDSAISISVWVNSSCCPLSTNFTTKSHKLSSARPFSEQRPWESGHILSA